MDRDTRLGLIADAILDGTAVDWPTVESSVDASDTRVIQQLRILEEITSLHRQADRAAVTRTAPAETARPAVTWGHLQIFEIVGRGTFGEVYRAWDPHLQREVALKVLRATPVNADGGASVGDPVRVVDEGRMLARVRHPHVITVYGAEPRDSSVGVWMEFIRGRTLHDLVAANGPFGTRETVAIGIDLCRALAAVHAAGLLHRDVSARNVMREEGGRVVLMDLGAGRDAPRQGTDTLQTDEVTGTPLYMAPELLAGTAASAASDVYAAGVLLFHAVSGGFPVSGRTIADVRVAHARATRTHLRDLRADLPAPFVTAIERAVAADPTERFQTAGALEAALERSLGQSLAAPPRSWQRPAIAAGVVLTAMAIALWERLAISDGDPSSGRAAGLPPQLTARRLTPPAAVWPFSNPSADGRLVAGQVTETGGLAIVDVEANTFRPIALGESGHSGGYASSGALSSDGRQVAVDWFDADGGALWIVGADGSAPRRLVAGVEDVTSYQWSADGRTILAAVRRGGAYAAVLVAASDGAVRQLHQLGPVAPRSMALAPDGRFVVYDAPANPADVDHDLFVLDAHTGERWPLASSPAHDESPLWAPDGQTVVFLSDRNRTPSLWAIPLKGGRQAGELRLVRDDIGRVALRGFDAGGALHYQLFAGFAEVHLASLARPEDLRTLSSRQALSNFYPVWSPDGRSVTFTSERRLAGRELWTHDIPANRDVRIPIDRLLGRPQAWAPDGRRILANGPNDGRLYIVDGTSGRSVPVAPRHSGRAAWTPAGLVYRTEGRVVVLDPDRGIALRTFGGDTPDAIDLSMADDGRSVLVAGASGLVRWYDTATARTREWTDPGIVALIDHLTRRADGSVAYAARRRDGAVESRTLTFHSANGERRELLRTIQPESFVVVGWTADETEVLVVRWRLETDAEGSPLRHERLWRVPIGGAPPVATLLTLEGLRDVSISPDGGHLAFNAGWKMVEHWVLENILK